MLNVPTKLSSVLCVRTRRPPSLHVSGLLSRAPSSDTRRPVTAAKKRPVAKNHAESVVNGVLDAVRTKKRRFLSARNARAAS